MQSARPPSAALALSRVDLRRLPWVKPLVADYGHQFDRLASFYAGNPSEHAAWTDVLDRTLRHPRQRDALADVLGAQLASRGAPPAAREAAARLRDPASVAVVTGQQAGLFGGPLYTLLKAVTAIALARRVSDRHHVPTVPVFWIDSEDHDWPEVASVTVLDADLVARRVTMPEPPGAGHLPVASLRIDGGAATALDDLRQHLPQTEFTAELLGDLHGSYAPGQTMSSAFGSLLERWLGPRGLVVFDCADPAAKPLAAEVFVHELRHPGRTSALAADAGAALEALGYHAQVEAHRDSTGLFHLDPERHPIRLAPGGFSIGSRLVEAGDLIAEARAHPDRFSPNVLVRPIVQDTLFPTAAYVGGPAELAYLGQLRRVYEHFGVPMPLVVPRVTATLLDAAAARFLERYQIPVEALQPDDESALNHLLESQLPSGVEEAYQAAQLAVRDTMGALGRAVPALDPTLEGAVRSTLGKMEHDLRHLHAKIIQAAKRRDETLRRQFRRTRSLVFPTGHLQERTLGAVYFLDRFGPALIDVIERDLEPDAGHHWLVTV